MSKTRRALASGQGKKEDGRAAVATGQTTRPAEPGLMEQWCLTVRATATRPSIGRMIRAGITIRRLGLGLTHLLGLTRLLGIIRLLDITVHHRAIILRRVAMHRPRAILLRILRLQTTQATTGSRQPTHQGPHRLAILRLRAIRHNQDPQSTRVMPLIRGLGTRRATLQNPRLSHPVITRSHQPMAPGGSTHQQGMRHMAARGNIRAQQLRPRLNPVPSSRRGAVGGVRGRSRRADLVTRRSTIDGNGFETDNWRTSP